MRDYILTSIKENEWNIRSEVKDWIENVEFNCFVNYLDSFIQTSVFCDYDMDILTEDKKYVTRFIADVWKEIKEKRCLI